MEPAAYRIKDYGDGWILQEKITDGERAFYAESGNLIQPLYASETLLSAAEAFITEAESMGWGETSETALPGSYDTLVKAVREAKG